MGVEPACKPQSQCRAPLLCVQTDEPARDPKSYPVPSNASTPKPESMGNSRGTACPQRSTKLAAERSVSNSFCIRHSGRTSAVGLPHPCQDPQTQTPRKHIVANASWDMDCAGRRPLATYTPSTHQWHHSSALLPPRDSASVALSHPRTGAARSPCPENLLGCTPLASSADPSRHRACHDTPSAHISASPSSLTTPPACAGSLCSHLSLRSHE